MCCMLWMEGLGMGELGEFLDVQRIFVLWKSVGLYVDSWVSCWL